MGQGTMGVVRVVARVATGALLAVPVIFTFVDTVGYVGTVSGGSMQPTLNPRGAASRDVVWMKRWGVGRRPPLPGSIVAINSPTDPGSYMIKRVVATEGETVLTHGYKSHRVCVPPGNCWVEGDNGRTSRDSNLFGPVPVGLIFAQATHVVWPPWRWQRLEQEGHRRERRHDE